MKQERGLLFYVCQTAIARLKRGDLGRDCNTQTGYDVVGQRPPTSQEQTRVLGTGQNCQDWQRLGVAKYVRLYKSDTGRPVSQSNGTGHQRMAAQAMGCKAEASGRKRKRTTAEDGQGKAAVRGGIDKRVQEGRIIREKADQMRE